MYAYTILIPLNLNNGEIVSPAKINSLRVRMVEEFGGYTHNPSPLNGVWKGDNGHIYHDTLNAYTIFSDTEQRIVAFAQYVAVALNQFCVSMIGPNGTATLVYPDETAAAA